MSGTSVTLERRRGQRLTQASPDDGSVVGPADDRAPHAQATVPSAARFADVTEGALFEERGLSVGYGSGAAVRKVDLGVGAGGVAALLGANGAGKSTTLPALERALRPLNGYVVYPGSGPVSLCTIVRATRADFYS